VAESLPEEDSLKQKRFITSIVTQKAIASDDPGLDTNLTQVEKDSQAAEWFAGMAGAHLRVDTRRPPAMHRSRTTDYIVLLSGEITLLLDEDEVDLKPFDTVIQRGTNHEWCNRGIVPALLMAVLVDGREDPMI
jgi:hypothetical protein